MKHRYNPFVYVAMFMGLALFSFTMFYFFPDYVKAYSKDSRGLDSMLMAVPVAIPSILFLNNMGKSVEILSEYIKFKNFRFNAFNSLKTFSITMGYESIIRIEAKKLPLIGIYKIVIISKNYPDPIPVSRLFLKHRQLFYTVCSQVQRYNKDALIDNDLLEFTEKYREKHE